MAVQDCYPAKSAAPQACDQVNVAERLRQTLSRLELVNLTLREMIEGPRPTNVAENSVAVPVGVEDLACAIDNLTGTAIERSNELQRRLGHL